MPFHPPSLAPDVLARAFKAQNGEIGVQIEDAASFLAACKQDEVEVFGWELWLADYSWDDTANRPRKVHVPGYWCGLIPDVESGVGSVYRGEGSAEDCQLQINALDFEARTLRHWKKLVRVNFTLGVRRGCTDWTSQ